MEHKEEFHLNFCERWTIGHKCDVPGCEWCVIIDADLKPHRMLCAAQLCGVREFDDADVRVVTGCTEMPGTKNKYCFKHQHEQSPILTGDKVTDSTRTKLRKHRKETAYSEEAPEDQMYIIEAINDMKNNDFEFLIKWAGFPNNVSTWEPSSKVYSAILSRRQIQTWPKAS